MNKKGLVIGIICFIGFLAISYFAYISLGSEYKEKSIESKTESSQNKNFKDLVKKDKTMEKDFVVYDEKLNRVKLLDYKGKPVVVNFWASWCPPCKAEMPDFNEISGKYSKDKLAVLMINLTDGQRETVDTAKQFIKENKYNNMKVLFDKDMDAAMNYNLESIPRTLFIDKDGYIIQDNLGQMSKEELENQIKSLLSD